MHKGKQLSQELKIECAQALSGEWGNFYAPIKKYPCVLFDEFGFLVVNSPDDLEKFGIRLGKRTNIPNRISSVPAYQSMAIRRARLTEKIPSNGELSYYEGAAEAVTVNRYERDKTARNKCTAYYGYLCQACGVDLSKKYGSVAKNFIHVHHITKISTIAKEYQVDPIVDLVPLCPNCHAVAHLRDEPYSIQEIKSMISDQENT